VSCEADIICVRISHSSGGQSSPKPTSDLPANHHLEDLVIDYKKI